MNYFYRSCINLMLIVLASCQSQFSDISSQQNYFSIIPAEEGYILGSPVWLTDSVIVFAYSPKMAATLVGPMVPDLRSYNTHQQKWEKVRIPTDENCHILSFSFLQRLPNQHLGFYNTCLSTSGAYTSIIQEMNIVTGETRTLLEFGPEISGGQFSFSPDMSELIQEDMTGRFLSNKLLYRHDGVSTQIVSNFTRAMYPSWSPIEREIAFWGTENYPGGTAENLETLPQISALALYPFDLYISSPEGTNLQKILSSVKDPLFIKWSPKESIIAFAGTLDGVSGLWLVNPSTVTVTRIWPNSGDFDWSPDGNKIVVITSEKDAAGQTIKQNISMIDVK